MKTIVNNMENEIIVNKSKFITNVIKVNSIDDINFYLNNIKIKYKDATHNCYAYICGSLKKCSDDAEPNGTAGLPILNVLEQLNLDNVLCIVTRYFGGVKLGAGGLVRAYTKSVTSCIDNINLKEIEMGKLIEITFKYDNSKLIDNLIKNATVISKNFDQNVTYIISIKNNDYKLIKDNLKLNCIDIDIKKDIII